MFTFGLFEHKDGIYTQVRDLFTDSIYNVTEILKVCNKPVFFVGNGGRIYQDVLKSTLKENAIIIDEQKYCNLTAFCTGIAGFNEYNLNGNSPLLPLYLKKSNAERELESKK